MSYISHVSYATGYLRLGMIQEAIEELSRIGRREGGQPAVLKLKLEIYQAAEDWAAMRRCARLLVRCEPQDGQNWISYGYATRRAIGLRSARRILLKAHRIHPDEAIVQFNLGCYASQLGKFEEANRWLLSAISLASICRELSLHDPDFEPLRTWFDKNLC